MNLDENSNNCIALWRRKKKEGENDDGKKSFFPFFSTHVGKNREQRNKWKKRAEKSGNKIIIIMHTATRANIMPCNYFLINLYCVRVTT